MTRKTSCLFASLALISAPMISRSQDDFLEKIGRDAVASRPADPSAAPLIPDRAREIEVLTPGKDIEGPFELTKITEEKRQNNVSGWWSFARRKGDTRLFLYACLREPQRTIPRAVIFPESYDPEAVCKDVTGEDHEGVVLIFHPSLREPFSNDLAPVKK